MGTLVDSATIAVDRAARAEPPAATSGAEGAAPRPSTTLPDLTDRLIAAGIYGDYCRFRDGYIRWRQGEARGARGWPCDGSAATARAAKDRLDGGDPLLIFEQLYPSLASFKFRRTVAYWMMVTSALGGWLFMLGGIFAWLGAGESEEFLNPLVNWPNYIGIWYFTASAACFFVQHLTLVRQQQRRAANHYHGADRGGATSEEESDSGVRSSGAVVRTNLLNHISALSRTEEGGFPTGGDGQHVSRDGYFVGEVISADVLASPFGSHVSNFGESASVKTSNGEECFSSVPSGPTTSVHLLSFGPSISRRTTSSGKVTTYGEMEASGGTVSRRGLLAPQSSPSFFEEIQTPFFEEGASGSGSSRRGSTMLEEERSGAFRTSFRSERGAATDRTPGVRDDDFWKASLRLSDSASIYLKRREELMTMSRRDDLRCTGGTRTTSLRSNHINSVAERRRLRRGNLPALLDSAPRPRGGARTGGAAQQDHVSSPFRAQGDGEYHYQKRNASLLATVSTAATATALSKLDRPVRSIAVNLPQTPEEPGGPPRRIFDNNSAGAAGRSLELRSEPEVVRGGSASSSATARADARFTVSRSRSDAGPLPSPAPQQEAFGTKNCCLRFSEKLLNPLGGLTLQSASVVALNIGCWLYLVGNHVILIAGIWPDSELGRLCASRTFFLIFVWFFFTFGAVLFMAFGVLELIINWDLSFCQHKEPWCALWDLVGGTLYFLGSLVMDVPMFCHDGSPRAPAQKQCSVWLATWGSGATFAFGASCYCVSATLGLLMWTREKFGWGLFAQLNRVLRGREQLGRWNRASLQQGDADGLASGAGPPRPPSSSGDSEQRQRADHPTSSSDHVTKLSRVTVFFNLVYTVAITVSLSNIFCDLCLLLSPAGVSPAEPAASSYGEERAIVAFLCQMVVLGLLHLMLVLHSDMTSLPLVQPYRLVVIGLRVLFAACCVVEILEFLVNLEAAGLIRVSEPATVPLPGEAAVVAGGSLWIL